MALIARGVVVSAGQPMAPAENAQAGFAACMTYGTHLFNDMQRLDHRAPGLPGAPLADPARTTGLIVDGIHLHPATVTLAWQANGPARFNLVTDAMGALGMPPGPYRLGDWEVIVDGRSARLADGRLAGSVLSLDEAVRNLIAFTGCPLEAALAAVTTVPAAVLGLQARRGQIAPGYTADLALLTADLQVQATVVAGEIVYTAAAEAPVATTARA